VEVVALIPARYGSTRFPGKPLALLRGKPMIQHVAQTLSADIIVNVQGDLPFFPPAMVEDAVTMLNRASTAAMSTVKTPIHEHAEWQNPNVVKVATDREGYALYFSRSPIPYSRDLKMGIAGQTGILGYRHIGLYVYRRDFLLAFPKLPRTALEQTEQLEQLRALEWGYRIVVSDTERLTIEVDTPDDLRRAEEALP
jgi:3-deoxy-manno-octulosonate cytidylyltransferase (CMP-KDO synthetase)